MGTPTKDKRICLQWCLQHLKFPRRETYWLLNYLMNHATILSNVHFVEAAEKAPRGLIIHTKATSAPMILVIDGQEFTDVDQIFHEIRLHWKQPLYVEIKFADSWQEPLYVGVLEDNPAASWNGAIEADVLESVDEGLAALAHDARKTELLDLIDDALECGDEALFKKLSQELKDEE